MKVDKLLCLPYNLHCAASAVTFNQPYVMLCAIWYHLYNLKNVKSNHGGVLLLVKLQTLSCNFTKSNTPP